MRARSSLFFSHHAKAVRELTARRTPPRTTSHFCIDDFKRLQVFYTWSHRTKIRHSSQTLLVYSQAYGGTFSFQLLPRRAALSRSAARGHTIAGRMARMRDGVWAPTLSTLRGHVSSRG